MIPLKITLKNFVSYGATPQEVDLSSHQLICLSGKNGHGKSALLDALTWALWGQARKVVGTAKADEGLLRLGQQTMMVCLDFSCNGQSYRVKREYSQLSGKAYTVLEFGIFDAATASLKPLTDKTLRATQEKIDQAIGLSYESFINSAFLRQGQSNEFSKKSPKERKEILATMLGLDLYEQLRKMAADKAKHASVELEHLTALIKNGDLELEKKGEITTSLFDLQQESEALTLQEQELAAQHQKLKDAQLSVMQQKNQRAQITHQFNQTEQAIIQRTQAVIATITLWRQIHKKQLTLVSTLQLEQEKAEIEKKLEKLHQQARHQLTLKEKLLETQEKLRVCLAEHEKTTATASLHATTALQEYRIALSSLEEQCRELTATLGQLIAEQHKRAGVRMQLIKKEEELRVDQSFLTHMSEQFERRKEFYQRFVATERRVRQDYHELLEKKNLSADGNLLQCQMCLQSISPEHQHTLLKQYAAKEEFYHHQLKRLMRLLKELKESLIRHHAELESLKKNSQEHQLITAQLHELQTAEQELDKKIIQKKELLTTVQNKLNDLQQQITTAQDAQRAQLIDAQKKLTENPEINALEQLIAHLTEQIKAESKTDQSESELRSRLAALGDLLKLTQENAKEQLLQEQRKEFVSTEIAAVKELKREKEKLSQALLALTTSVEQEQKLLLEEQQLTSKAQLLASAKERLVHSKGALEQHYKLLLAQEEEQKKRVARSKELAQFVHEYTLLASALSKDGIQALLIEDALPEIEREANYLLARLTDNQSQITIESLRDLKSGGAKETLDIKISDSVGIRPYELFSGGEAFRIDFALRIALSKLLAQRAGTSLQTLIIDEGFGSQDEEGLAHIMQAIYKIQDDFAKIIIVSHLASMKEQFPVHFQIVKTAQGSTISVIEHG